MKAHVGVTGGGNLVIVADNEHNWPHVRSCEACRNARVCWRCGQPIQQRTRCTSGACIDCCGPDCAHAVR